MNSDGAQRGWGQSQDRLAQLDTDLQAIAGAIHQLASTTGLGVVVPIGQGGTGATTAANARINLELGSAAQEAASDPTQANVASVLLPVIVGHSPIFADIHGTISDGGASPFSPGSAASKDASNPADPVVASVTGAVTIGDFAVIADASGSIQTGGPVGAAAHQAYVTGIWTPMVQFGGGSTGITYSTQLGSYTRIGREIFCRAVIALTSDGSATGQATVAGLPFPSNVDATNAASGGHAISYGSMSGLGGGGGLQVQVGPGSSAITLLSTGTSTTATLTNSNFTNTSTLNLSFSYFM